MRHTVIGKATKALVTVVAAAFGAGMLAGPAAVAADTPNGNIGLPDGEKGSITVHKYTDEVKWLNPDQKNNGTELSAPADAKVLKDVSFTIYKVRGLDLTKAESWTGVKEAKVAAGENPQQPENVTVNGKTYQIDRDSTRTVTTNERGIAAFTNLDLGLYYVVESGIGNNPITKKAAPFFITIPYAAQQGNWNYNPHVYPKNTVNTSGEKIADTTDTAKVGDIITWDITQTLPGSEDGYTAIGAVDPLDTNLALAKADKSEIPFDGSSEEALKEAVSVMIGSETIDSDLFTVTPVPVADGRHAIRVELVKGDDGKISDPYLQGLLAGTPVVKISIRTIVKTMPANGEVPNTAYKIINEYDPFNAPGNPGNPDNPGGETPPPGIPTVETPRFGDYAFKKVDDTTAKNALEGAVFEVKDGNKVVAQATSDKNGYVHFTGLFLGKRAGNELVEKEFTLVEKTAPAGYKLLTQPITITVKQGAINVATDAAKFGPEVVNEKSDLPQLPLTGAAGKVLLTLTGAALIALASGTYMVSRRRMRSEI
ncbi:SpaH/EbpB family LPXTG-anchored major pilin [Schaalia sp. ZJ405]|uniref:SpaH/EbpB family LPXTG-anchored major pilin n=1 Tax=Schaalia sp. ZJ405 TaxID=2709403 RepID=UPI0013EB37B4|nr:SpaH/EbpB family LPXTG-anchored major pilin [Schaalia sp. ZJ405]QPK80691.1 SpaH/EbpB family LPXTG-anchored major pilin [Schaalia sp. ZJ405]